MSCTVSKSGAKETNAATNGIKIYMRTKNDWLLLGLQLGGGGGGGYTECHNEEYFQSEMRLTEKEVMWAVPWATWWHSVTHHRKKYRNSHPVAGISL